MTKRKTTKLMFDKFCNSFLKYVEVYGLQNWRLLFRCSDVGCDACATIKYCTSTMSAVVSLADHYDDDTFPEFDPEYCGRHEATHLLLADLIEVLKNRNSTEEQMDDAEERLVILLSRLSIERIKSKKAWK